MATCVWRRAARLGRGPVSASVLLALAAAPAHAQYTQHNLVSNGAVPADHTDTNLRNPWGLTPNPTGFWWISDNHAGTSTLYDALGNANSLIVNIPSPGSGDMGAPTGVVFSGSNTDFFLTPGANPARFLFAGEDGVISAWAPNVPPPAPSTQAQRMFASPSGAIYKGIALATTAGGGRLYATDFHNGRIDTFDSSFAPITPAGGFTDPNLPAGYAPFNIMNIGNRLLVTYAQQDANGEDDVPGDGHGFIDAFNFDGALLGRLASRGDLNSPWGMALAPADFGPLSGALLVGNFGDGHINALDPTTGAPIGQLSDTSGNPIQIDDLWGLAFGNGNVAGPTNMLFFTAGVNDEADGLFGSIAIPAPGTACLLGAGVWLLRRRRET